MITTSLDVLYISLAVGFIVLVIFLAITLLYTIFILRDVSGVTNDVKEVTERVNQVVVSPLRLAQTIIEHVKPYIEAAVERGTTKRSTRRKSE